MLKEENPAENDFYKEEWQKEERLGDLSVTGDSYITNDGMLYVIMCWENQ